MKTKTEHTTGNSKPKLVSRPTVRVIHPSIAFSAMNLKIVVFIRFCMADKVNGQGLPFAYTTLIKMEISNMTALRDTLVVDSENWSTD